MGLGYPNHFVLQCLNPFRTIGTAYGSPKPTTPNDSGPNTILKATATKPNENSTREYGFIRAKRGLAMGNTGTINQFCLARNPSKTQPPMSD